MSVTPAPTNLRVALTGATGFLGSHVLRRLREASVEPVLLRRSEPEGVDLEWRRWDALDTFERMAEALHDIDVVCHLAAHVPADMRAPVEAEMCVRVNSIGSLRITRAARAVGVPRIVHTSSANILVPTGRPVRETDHISDWHEHAPYYLGSKALAEVFVAAQRGPGLQILTLRPSVIYGPGMRPNVITAFAERIARGEAVALHDGGRYQADFVEVDDVARVLVRAIRSDHGGIVNVGSGVATSIRDLAELICRLLDADPCLMRIEPAGAKGSTGFGALDIERARAWFDFEPTALEEGLRRYLRFTGLL